MTEDIQIISGFQENQQTQETSKNQIQDVKRTPLRKKILCGIFFISSVVSITLLIYNFIKDYTWWYNIYDYLELSIEILLLLGLIPIGILLNTEYKPSRLIKIFGGLFGLLGIILLVGSSLSFFQDGGDYDLEACLIYGLAVLLFIGLILIGVLINYTQKVEAYYHPSLLTKIFCGFLRFIGIFFIWSGISNFLLIGSEDFEFFKILIIAGIIILCGMGFIYLGILLYSTKKIVNLGITLILSIIISLLFGFIIDKFGGDFFGDLEDFINPIILCFCLFFDIITIVWGIKCFRLKKRGKASGKILNQEPSNKKIGYITTCILFIILIADLFYGKILWSKIPEIDDSIFSRDYHQTKLSDDEDALVQLRAFYSGYTNTTSYLDPLDSYYLYERNSSYYSNNYNKDISWNQHSEECIVINSGGNEYCGTWTWNKNTLDRILNNYYYIGNNGYMKDFIDDDGYLSIDGKKVTIFQYINKYEPEIRSMLEELDRITSLDYYLPDDEILDLIPPALQGYARASMVTLQYYTYQEDWNMVMFIIKLNYKFVDIFNDSGSFINQLIGIVIQNIVNSNINSLIQIFPKEFREELSKRYSTQIHDKDEIISKMMKGEYVIRNWVKNSNNGLGIGDNEPSLSQILFHFPFFSEKDTNKLMNYSYYLIWKEYNNYDNTDIINNIFDSYSIYNKYGEYIYRSLLPRLQSISDRMDRALYNKESLVKNLKSGKYDVWFDKLTFEYNDNNRIPTNEEIIENIIKKYSDIIDPCFGRYVLDPDYNPYYYQVEFGYTCNQILTELKKFEDDNFGLKEILIEITKGYIDYSEIISQDNLCRDEGGICENSFNEGNKIIKKLNKNYIELIKVLENIENEAPEIDINEYFYIPEITYDIVDEPNNTDELNEIELPESISIIKTYSDIINPCFGKDVIDPVYNTGYYHNELEEICNKTLIELKKQENDDFGLKETLINITKLFISYSKIELKDYACRLKEGVIGDICEKIFDKRKDIINNIKQTYIKLSNILKNIENENSGINLNKYFYIPYEKIYDESNLTLISFFIDQEKSEEILNDIELQESINRINENEKKLISSDKTNEQLNYEKLVNLTNECMGENILLGRISLTYDNHINQCNYTLGKLENIKLTGDFIKLNNILISINKERLEYANIRKDENLLFEKDGIIIETKYGISYQNGDSPEWDILFKKGDKNVENIKIYYTELENLTKRIKEIYKINPNIEFYIPYKIIKENTFNFFYKNSIY